MPTITGECGVRRGNRIRKRRKAKGKSKAEVSLNPAREKLYRALYREQDGRCKRCGVSLGEGILLRIDPKRKLVWSNAEIRCLACATALAWSLKKNSLDRLRSRESYR